MKISDKLLSIPPYISTRWENVASITIQGGNLVVILTDGNAVDIPDLSRPVIDAIFDMHSKFLEQDPQDLSKMPKEELFPSNAGGTIPFKLGSVGIGGIDSLGSAMHHNPEQMDAPDLPPEILKKITSIAKVLGINDPENMPKPEPHCNCVHCQIAKALQSGSGIHEENLDEEVSDEDLKFRSWDIEQMTEKLYIVVNPLDKKEKYNVFLGEPVGCTCGERNCEHVKAVLNS